MFSCAGAASNNICRVVITGLQGLLDFSFTTAGTVRFYFYMDNFFDYVVADHILLFCNLLQNLQKALQTNHHQIPKKIQILYASTEFKLSFSSSSSIHSYVHSFTLLKKVIGWLLYNYVEGILWALLFLSLWGLYTGREQIRHAYNYLNGSLVLQRQCSLVVNKLDLESN